MTIAVQVHSVTPDLRPAVVALRVHPEQMPFSGTMPEVLESAETDPDSEPMVVLVNGVPVGYYRLHFAPGAVAERTFPELTVGLRAFFVAADAQGQGIGRRALEAMVEDLRARRPDVQQLALSVNFRNAPAIALYERFGFTRDPEAYLGGAAGPQHVMTLRL